MSDLYTAAASSLLNFLKLPVLPHPLSGVGYGQSASLSGPATAAVSGDAGVSLSGVQIVGGNPEEIKQSDTNGDSSAETGQTQETVEEQPGFFSVTSPKETSSVLEQPDTDPVLTSPKEVPSDTQLPEVFPVDVDTALSAETDSGAEEIDAPAAAPAETASDARKTNYSSGLTGATPTEAQTLPAPTPTETDSGTDSSSGDDSHPESPPPEESDSGNGQSSETEGGTESGQSGDEGQEDEGESQEETSARKNEEEEGESEKGSGEEAGDALAYTAVWDSGAKTLTLEAKSDNAEIIFVTGESWERLQSIQISGVSQADWEAINRNAVSEEQVNLPCELHVSGGKRSQSSRTDTVSVKSSLFNQVDVGTVLVPQNEAASSLRVDYTPGSSLSGILYTAMGAAILCLGILSVFLFSRLRKNKTAPRLAGRDKPGKKAQPSPRSPEPAPDLASPQEPMATQRQNMASPVQSRSADPSPAQSRSAEPSSAQSRSADPSSAQSRSADPSPAQSRPADSSPDDTHSPQASGGPNQMPDPSISRTQPDSMSFGQLINIGKRDSQQDSMGLVKLPGGAFAAVADGMGGLKGGDVISQKIISTLLQDVANMPVRQVGENLPQLISHVNSEINQMLGYSEQYKSGSTLIAVAAERDCFRWIAVGDSRIYLYRAGSLLQINHEHVYETELLTLAANREISFAQAKNHAKRRSVTSFIGMGELRYIDLSLNPVHVQRGDRILLMSDGVFHTLSEQEMSRILSANSDAAQAASALEAAVLQKNNPYQDNFCTILIDYR